MRNRAQELLFHYHQEHFPDLYRPKDTRRQNLMVTIPGPIVHDSRPDQEELVLNDIVEVPVRYAQEIKDGKWGQDSRLCHDSPLESGAHNPRSTEGLVHR